MRLFNSTNNKFIQALMLPMLLGVSGCISDDDLCPESTASNDRDKGVVMQFTMVSRAARNSSTRTVAMPDAIENGFPDENYLDLSSLQFLLFDKDQVLLESFNPEVYAIAGTDFIKYTVRATMTNDYFTDADSSIDPNLTFSIMVIGNTKDNLNCANVTYPPGMTLAECFTKDPSATFDQPVRLGFCNYWKPNHTGEAYTDALGYTSDSYGGFDGQKSYIPMSGLQTFSVPIRLLKGTSYEMPLQLSDDANGAKDINMLRALAKIEVIDKINAYKDDDGKWHQPNKSDRTYIEKAELMGYVTKGSVLPSNLSAWELNKVPETQYCASPSIPTSGTFNDVTPYNDVELDVGNQQILNFFADREATEKREDGCTVFSCYVTEYNSLMAAGKTPMWIRCTVFNPGQTDDEMSIFYRIWVRPYDENGEVSGYTNLVRNNIYRYEVVSIQQEVELKWTICNMDDASTYIPTFN